MKRAGFNIKIGELGSVFFLWSAFISGIIPQSKFPNLVQIDSTTKFTHLNINNISSSFSNDGLADYDDYTSGSFKYPKNISIGGYWYSGLIIGGKVSGEVRVSGTYYWTSMKPAGSKRIFRVRKDYKYGNLSSEFNDGEGTEVEIKNNYEKDWNDWPASKGAPFEDTNKNGTYEPSIDIPGFPGSDQTIWFTANDFDSTLVKKVFGSLPLGIEIQYTYWAYNAVPPLGNTIFRKYKIINKSSNKIQEMYCSIASDPDIGDVGDDYVGCDTLLELAFVYNAKDSDFIWGNVPPTLGYTLLRGPITNNNKKLPASSFNPFINNYGFYSFPATRSYENGALWWYNLFQGRTIDGNYYQVPQKFGRGNTAFPFSGNPVTKEGWLDGDYAPGNNRGMNLSTGLFELNPGESQEIVFALVAAGGYNNITRLKAIDSLKTYVKYVKGFYKQVDTLITNIDINIKTLPYNYQLFQNYPNPFNPSTVIGYQLPVEGYVTLKVYDMLGRDVVTLVNEEKAPGYYEVKFNKSNLSNGVYFYRMQSGSFSQTKKFVLIK